MNKRLFLVVLQQTRSIETVVLRTIGEGATHRRARQWAIIEILPFHREWRQMPVVSAWNSGGVGILLLMAARAIQPRHAFAFRTADDVGKVTVAIVSLLGIVGGGV